MTLSGWMRCGYFLVSKDGLKPRLRRKHLADSTVSGWVPPRMAMVLPMGLNICWVEILQVIQSRHQAGFRRRSGRSEARTVLACSWKCH